jgi:hypothetical protein
MAIEQYKTKLTQLSKQLDSYDPNKADIDPKVLDQMFQIVYESDILDITYLEKKVQDEYKLELFTMLTKHSGTLAFLIIQILAAHNIMNKNSYAKKEYYFKKKCGIAINHLRAPKTFVRGVKVDGGYLLYGDLTWASGYRIFDTLLIGFHDGDFEVEAMAPFLQNDGFDVGEPDDTFVGYGLNTVNITLKDFFVSDEDIVSSNKKGNYTQNKSASKTVHMCLYSLGYNALENLLDSELQNYLTNELCDIKNRFMSSSDIDELDQLRIKLFTLVHQGITTAMILNGGKSILLSEQLQRAYKELLMFNANGLNNTLKSLFKEQYFKGAKCI